MEEKVAHNWKHDGNRVWSSLSSSRNSCQDQAAGCPPREVLLLLGLLFEKMPCTSTKYLTMIMHLAWHPCIGCMNITSRGAPAFSLTAPSPAQTCSRLLPSLHVSGSMPLCQVTEDKLSCTQGALLTLALAETLAIQPRCVADHPKSTIHVPGGSVRAPSTGVQVSGDQLHPAISCFVTLPPFVPACFTRENVISHLHGLCHRLRRTTSTKLSPCTNDGEMRHGKTWIRASTGQGLWTHGGSVRVDRGSGLDWFQIGDGMQMNTSECPSPVCERADPWRLHIYHYRCAAL